MHSKTPRKRLSPGQRTQNVRVSAAHVACSNLVYLPACLFKHTGRANVQHSQQRAAKRAQPATMLSQSFKDKTRAARAVGSDLEVAVVKATNHDIVPPKRKHVLSTFDV